MAMEAMENGHDVVSRVRAEEVNGIFFPPFFKVSFFRHFSHGAKRPTRGSSGTKGSIEEARIMMDDGLQRLSLTIS